jgi:hypothetical protein
LSGGERQYKILTLGTVTQLNNAVAASEASQSSENSVAVLSENEEDVLSENEEDVLSENEEDDEEMEKLSEESNGVKPSRDFAYIKIANRMKKSKRNKKGKVVAEAGKIRNV